jgi:glycosyltransferase involved in cell wall biosynthesis
MADVTIVILTKNEEKNIEECLVSVKDFAERVVIVDSGSNDRTVEIAKKYGADVYEHKFENHAKQFNWGLNNTDIKTAWTMRLDADERLTGLLCEELLEIMKEHAEDDINGVIMEADLYFMDRLIKHGGHKKRKLMFFKTGIGYIEDRKMDEHTMLKSGQSVIAKNRFIHYDYKNLTAFINKMNWYATREMQDYFEYNSTKGEFQDAVIAETRKKKFGFYYKMPLFFRSWLLFIYNYIFKLGFLDGKEGFIYHYMYQRWYRTLVDAKIYEQMKYNSEFEETGDLK